MSNRVDYDFVEFALFFILYHKSALIISNVKN